MKKKGYVDKLKAEWGLEGMDPASNYEKLLPSIKWGVDIKLRNTPTLLINGRKIVGTKPDIFFYSVIDYLMTNK